MEGHFILSAFALHLTIEGFVLTTYLQIFILLLKTMEIKWPVKTIRWNEEKNQLLILQRKLSFEQVLDKLEQGDFLAKRRHPDIKKYPNQYIFVLELNGYICYVPFVENKTEIFLKTIILSRKLNLNP